jgi:hypothetical protein
MYPVSKVNKEFEKAKKSYGVEPSTHQVRSAKALGAKLVKGAVVRQSAGQAIVQSDQGMIAIIFRKENAVATGSEGTWMIKARHARVQERMADGKRVSLDLYDDVTLSSSEFVQTLNSGIAMGVDIKPAAKKMDGTGGRMNRMPSQWERKTIKVNKK